MEQWVDEPPRTLVEPGKGMRETPMDRASWSRGGAKYDRFGAACGGGC